MKPKFFPLPFLVLAILAAPSTSYSFHNPGTGRWISRDPAGEDNGGPNLYQFVGNAGTMHFDILGLEWRVWRDGMTRADARGDCGDTLRSLASKIHFDPSEYRKWAIPIAGEELPDSADEPLSGYAWFSLPNTVYVNRVGWWPSWILGTTWRQRHALWMQGFRIQAQAELDNDAVLRQFTDADTYGFVNVAHGESEQYGHGEIETTDSRGLRLSQVQNALSHKLGGFMLIQCWGDEIDWRLVLSPRAYYWAGHGSIHYWDIPTARFGY